MRRLEKDFVICKACKTVDETIGITTSFVEGIFPPFHPSYRYWLEQPVKAFEAVDEAVYIDTVSDVVAFHHFLHLACYP